MTLILAGIAGMALCAPAGATDGQIDLRIDPAAGAAITQPGSYVVVENVTMTADIPAITITANNVTLDLGGHVLTGLAGGSADGISASTVSKLKIMNGSIEGFGDDGIHAFDYGRLEDLSIHDCGGYGILMRHRNQIRRTRIAGNNKAGNKGGIYGDDYCEVSDCVVVENSPAAAGGLVGIRLYDRGRIERNEVTSHTATGEAVGIFAQGHAIITGNQVGQIFSTQAGQSVTGIRSAAGAVITGNTVSYCSGLDSVTGISTAEASVVENNTAHFLTASGSNTLIGIYTSGGCTIRGNTVNYMSQTGSGSCWGIYANINCVIVNNNASQNHEGYNGAGTCVGIEAGSGSLIQGNTCNSNVFGGSDGSARGIRAASNSRVVGNVCDNNDALGSGDAAGIEASSSCRVVDNQCTRNSGGMRSHGIRITSTGNHVSGNTCVGNGTAGLIFSTGTNNRSEGNRFRQTVGVDTTNGANPSSLGAGDFADLNY